MLSNSDDRSGGVAGGIFITLVSNAIATAVAMFERRMQSYVDIKNL